jgi:hypothetical protein
MSDEAEGIDLEGFEGFTPGPWEPDLHLDEGDAWRVIEAEIPGVKRSGTVADTLNRDCCIDPDEDRANAALLAAAPRLLASARESRSRIVQLEAEVEKLREERDRLVARLEALRGTFGLDTHPATTTAPGCGGSGAGEEG